MKTLREIVKEAKAIIKKYPRDTVGNAAQQVVIETLEPIIKELEQQNTEPFVRTIHSVRIINNRRYIAIDEILGDPAK